MLQSSIVCLMSRAEKALRKRSVTSAVQSQNVNILAIILDKILHPKLFGKTFNPELWKFRFYKWWK